MGTVPSRSAVPWALLASVVTAVVVLARVIRARRAGWVGLTESQVRAKLDARMRGRVSGEERAAIANLVVAKMRSRGKLAADEAIGKGS